MTELALGLIVLSALAHAGWNYLSKTADDPFVFFWLFAAVGGLIYLPVAIIAAHAPTLTGAMLWFIAGTVALHLAYFRLLTAAYARSDLSAVYPIARGTGLAIAPIGAVVLLHEHVSPEGAIAIAVIFFGVLLAHTRGTGLVAVRTFAYSVRETGSVLAFLTGIVIACYSLWDKNALQTVPPAVLIDGIFVGQAVCFAPYVWIWRRGAVIHEIRMRPRSVLIAAVAAPLAYLLVLIALTFTRVSYVTPAREIGIVVGTLLGTTLLGEGYRGNRLIGAVMIVVGVTGLAFSP